MPDYQNKRSENPSSKKPSNKRGAWLVWHALFWCVLLIGDDLWAQLYRGCDYIGILIYPIVLWLMVAIGIALCYLIFFFRSAWRNALLSLVLIVGLTAGYLALCSSGVMLDLAFQVRLNAMSSVIDLVENGSLIPKAESGEVVAPEEFSWLTNCGKIFVKDGKYGKQYYFYTMLSMWGTHGFVKVGSIEFPTSDNNTLYEPWTYIKPMTEGWIFIDED